MAGIWAPALKVFGLYPLVTGILGWSPLYAILGLRTNRSQPGGRRQDLRRP